MYEVKVGLKDWKIDNIKSTWELINAHCLKGIEKKGFTDIFLSDNFQNGNSIPFSFSTKERADSFASELFNLNSNIFDFSKSYIK